MRQAIFASEAMSSPLTPQSPADRGWGGALVFASTLLTDHPPAHLSGDPSRNGFHIESQFCACLARLQLTLHRSVLSILPRPVRSARSAQRLGQGSRREPSIRGLL